MNFFVRQAVSSGRRKMENAGVVRVRLQRGVAATHRSSDSVLQFSEDICKLGWVFFVTVIGFEPQGTRP